MAYKAKLLGRSAVEDIPWYQNVIDQYMSSPNGDSPPVTPPGGAPPAPAPITPKEILDAARANLEKQYNQTVEWQKPRPYTEPYPGQESAGTPPVARDAGQASRDFLKWLPLIQLAGGYETAAKVVPAGLQGIQQNVALDYNRELQNHRARQLAIDEQNKFKTDRWTGGLKGAELESANAIAMNKLLAGEKELDVTGARAGLTEAQTTYNKGLEGLRKELALEYRNMEKGWGDERIIGQTIANIDRIHFEMKDKYGVNDRAGLYGTGEFGEDLYKATRELGLDRAMKKTTAEIYKESALGVANIRSYSEQLMAENRLAQNQSQFERTQGWREEEGRWRRQHDAKVLESNTSLKEWATRSGNLIAFAKINADLALGEAKLKQEAVKAGINTSEGKYKLAAARLAAARQTLNNQNELHYKYLKEKQNPGWSPDEKSKKLIDAIPDSIKYWENQMALATDAVEDAAQELLLPNNMPNSLTPTKTDVGQGALRDSTRNPNVDTRNLGKPPAGAAGIPVVKPQPNVEVPVMTAAQKAAKARSDSAAALKASAEKKAAAAKKEKLKQRVNNLPTN